MNRERAMSATALTGTLLTAVIVAMSVGLRLAPLPPDIEAWARIVHRVAAAGVGLAAALAFVVAFGRGTSRSPHRAITLMVVGATALLAVVGRYTPGYRFEAVTAVNVAGGTILACAFWWLGVDRGRVDLWASAALATLVVAAITGALAIPGHAVAGIECALFAFAVAWRERREWRRALLLALLAGGQVALGFHAWSLSPGQAVAATWLHAMLSLALAVRLAASAWRHREEAIPGGSERRVAARARRLAPRRAWDS